MPFANASRTNLNSMKPNHTPNRLIRTRRLLTVLLAILLTAMTCNSVRAGEADSKLVKSVIEPEEPSRFHALVNLEFSDHYITPRGLDVENQGVVFQPLVLLFLNLYSSKDAFLSDVTLTTGVWNSWHTRKSGATPRQWNEIDPIVGLTFKLAKDLQFDAFYTAFNSQTNSYDTSTNLDLKLTYHDHLFKGFTINPYVEYFDEISKKATVAFNSDTSDTSFYFALGIDPTYNFTAVPLRLEFPTFVNIVENSFYQRFDGTDGGSGVAVFSTEIKGTVPLKFIPKSYGNWSFYAGVQYYHLDNPGVLDGNEVLGATSERKHNLLQLHCGLTAFF